MLEEFISVALEAFTSANGDADKFELQLRRKLMTYNTMIPQTVTPSVVSPSSTPQSVDNIVSSFTPNDEIFKELEGVDINTLDDNQILALAAKLGLTDKQEENE